MVMVESKECIVDWIHHRAIRASNPLQAHTQVPHSALSRGPLPALLAPSLLSSCPRNSLLTAKTLISTHPSIPTCRKLCSDSSLGKTLGCAQPPKSPFLFFPVHSFRRTNALEGDYNFESGSAFTWVQPFTTITLGKTFVRPCFWISRYRTYRQRRASSRMKVIHRSTLGFSTAKTVTCSPSSSLAPAPFSAPLGVWHNWSSVGDRQPVTVAREPASQITIYSSRLSSPFEVLSGNVSIGEISSNRRLNHWIAEPSFAENCQASAACERIWIEELRDRGRIPLDNGSVRPSHFSRPLSQQEDPQARRGLEALWNHGRLSAGRHKTWRAMGWSAASSTQTKCAWSRHSKNTENTTLPSAFLKPDVHQFTCSWSVLADSKSEWRDASAIVPLLLARLTALFRR